MREINERLLLQISQLTQKQDRLPEEASKPQAEEKPAEEAKPVQPAQQQYIANVDVHRQKQIEKRQQIRIESDYVSFSNFQKPIAKKYICGICLEPLKQPVTLECGHSFCLKCLDLCESFQYHTGGQFDQSYQCPGRVTDLTKHCLSRRCECEYDEQPGIDIVLAKEINDLLQFNEKIAVGDYVYLFEDDFG